MLGLLSLLGVIIPSGVLAPLSVLGVSIPGVLAPLDVLGVKIPSGVLAPLDVLSHPELCKLLTALKIAALILLLSLGPVEEAFVLVSCVLAM